MKFKAAKKIRSLSGIVSSTLFIIVALTVIVSQTAHAQNQAYKLLPDDGAERDMFGITVAISKTTAVVGSRYDDDNGEISGSAYLFDTATGQQIAKLLPDNGAMLDCFGTSVAIKGTTAIISASGYDYNSGAVYLFDTATGQQIAMLIPDDGELHDYFGASVAIKGTTAIIGATGDDDHGARSGSAYLFDTVTGQQIAKLIPDDGEAYDYFGISVAVSGTTAIVGAYGDDDNGSDSGSVYLFDTITGAQIAKLLPADGSADDQFGRSVAIKGTMMIVGAYKDNDNGVNSGSAYLFDVNVPSKPIQIAKLLPDDGSKKDYFGRSVAISNSTAIVGATDIYDSKFCSAYLFDITTGQQIAKLFPDDGMMEDGFGLSVAIKGTMAIVGAYTDNDNGYLSGSAYILHLADPLLTVSPDPMIAGQDGTFTGTNLKPNTKTYLAYSLAGLGSTYVPYLNITLDLASPTRVHGMRNTDSTGYVTAELYIPPGASGRNIWFQGCQFELKTNVVTTSIQ